MEIYLPIAEMSVNPILVIMLGALVGMMSGIFGVGGGFLMTPILFFIGIPPAVAVSTEATQILASSVSGALAHFRRGNLDFKMGGLLTLGGLSGSTVGVQVFKLLNDGGQLDLVIRISYVVFLGLVGGLMMLESVAALRRRNATANAAAGAQSTAAAQGTSTTNGKKKSRPWFKTLPPRIKFGKSRVKVSIWLPLGVGFFVGFLSAIMGVGGGFIMVPAMIYLLGMPTIVVVGTSLFYIIFVMINTTMQQAVTNQTVDIVLAILLLIGGVIGAQIGARLSGRFNAEQLRIVLAGIVLAVCLKILYDLFVSPANPLFLNIVGLGGSH